MPIATPDELNARREVVEHSQTLRELAARLRRFLDPILEGPLLLPQAKAMLSRDGGVCADDGSRLAFDPLSPHVHTCLQCGRTFQGERHHRAWIWRYHLWLSERAIHLALLAGLIDDPRLARRATDVLEAYAELYPSVPNRDNVLGPTRLFFSTYLESIWLTQLVIAAALLESSDESSNMDDGLRTTLSPVIRESAELVACFDEGWSNRQVWNNTALIAAGRWLGDEGLVAKGLNGGHGIRAQLSRAVTRDGLWFEGENYHFFALRGLLLAAELLRTDGIDLYHERGVGAALSEMFAAPLATVLPDLTVPARSDAPFGVSLLQPRFAELWEIGRARTGDPRVESFLSHLYAVDVPEREDPGLVEIAEQEQNRIAARLSRERLGWKALLLMVPDPPRAQNAQWRRGTCLMKDAGLAILRPEERTYVSVECGGPQSGHGHPDLLHLTLFWHRPLLADYGTGSYVVPSLHWYRSTLAHNAPGLAGLGQVGRRGWCSALDERSGWAWCRVTAPDMFGAGSAATRTVVVSPRYVIDVVDVNVPNEVTVDLPVHPVGGVNALEGAVGGGAGGAEGTGAAKRSPLSALAEMRTVAESLDRITSGVGRDQFDVIFVRRSRETVFLATAPGPPDAQFADGAPSTFLIRRARGSGRWIQVYAPEPSAVVGVEEHEGAITVLLHDGTTERLVCDGDRLRVTDCTGREHLLQGALAPLPPAAVPQQLPRPSIVCPLLDRVPAVDAWQQAVPDHAVTQLGEQHYRRSERPYQETLPFSARVAVFAVGSRLCFAAEVEKHALCIRAAGDPEPQLDNEAAEIHSDGLQCYLGLGAWSGYLVVPDPEPDRVRVRAVAGTAGDSRRVTGSWCRTDAGYCMIVAVETGRRLEAGQAFPVNLVINQMMPGRQRRAGQLVLSARAGWVYLRGDREDPTSAVIAEVA